MGMFDFIGRGKKSSSLSKDPFADLNKSSSLGAPPGASSLGSSSNSSSSFPSSSPSTLSSKDPFSTPPSRPSMPTNPSNSLGNPNMKDNLTPGSGFGNDPSLSGSSQSSMASKKPVVHNEEQNSLSHESQLMNKNIEIIMSKLDTIRTAIENIDHRMNLMESSLQEKTSKDDYGKW